MPCLAMSLIAGAWVYPALTGGFLLVALANPHPLAATTRALVYSLTIAALSAYIMNLALPIDSERFFFPFIEYLFPFAICLATCLCFLRPSQVRLSLIITLAGLAMMIEGSCITNPHDSALAAYGPLWRNRFWIYGVFVVMQTIALLPLLLQTQRFGLCRTTAPTKPPKNKRLIFLYSLGMLAGFAVVSAQLTLHAERLLEPTFRRIFNFYLEMYRPQVVFGGDVDLNRKNSAFVSTHGDRIVLRAVSEQAPGYLRGRAYESYEAGRWSGVERDTKLRAVHDEDLVSTRFLRRVEENAGATIDIHPSRHFYSDVLLATGNAHSLELIADSITSNHNGELLPQSWDRGGAYTLFAEKGDDAQAFTGPFLSEDTLYLAVPSELEPALSAYADLNFPARLSPLQRVRAIEAQLQSTCEYELGVSLPGERDPILEFLFDLQRGHCELYASTAVMLLRAQGIPARYVTGFACMERHPLQGCFVSRVGDCHAWAEAWLADEQRWVLVEATPQAGLPDDASRASFLAGLFELPRTAWKKLYSNIKRGHFAVAVLAFFADFAAILAQLFWRGPWCIGWGTLALVTLLCWARWRRRHPPETALIRQYHALLRELECRLQKLGITRPKNATVAMLANSARELRTPQAERLADLLLHYQALRFRPSAPSADEIESLRNELVS
ncbi:MAG: transglutaminase-like putative cysteine protease [Rhodothermales bacterium]|jgi:transglutaminase-like putative cysteine protease